MLSFWFQKHIVFRMNCFYIEGIVWKCDFTVTEELKYFEC